MSITAPKIDSLPLNQFENLVELLNFRASHQANQVAYTFLNNEQTENLTYRELDQQAQTIAAQLILKASPGDRALLLYQPGLEYIAAFFGCLYAGIIAVPAYVPRPNRSIERLESILIDSQSKVALTTTSTLINLGGKLEQFPTLKALEWITTDHIEDETINIEQKLAHTKHKLAFLQYTSGSTSAPKGVMISHQNLLHNLKLIHQCFGHATHSKGVIWLPPYHDMGLIGGILAPLYGGFPVVLMSPFLFLQRPIRWLRAISQYQATTSGGPNFAYDLCVQKIKTEDLIDIDLSSWEVAFNGAEPIRADCMRRFTEKFEPYGFRHESFYPCYGMAEATLIISGGLRSAAPMIKKFDRISLEQNQVKQISNHESESQELVGCGQTLPEQEIIIAHPDKLIQCQNGEVGEIWVQGPSVAQGYWNQTEKTQEIFNTHLISSGKGPYLRTGDLGFIQDEELFITGRLKDIIIIRGSNYYPQDIERTVEQSHSSLCSNASAAFSIELDNEERLVIVAEIERRYSRCFRQSVNQSAHEKSEQKFDSLQLNSDQIDGQSKEQLTVLNQLVGNIREAVTQQYNLQPCAIALIQIGSIPKTSSGKVQRYACKKAFLKKTLNLVHMYCLF